MATCGLLPGVLEHPHLMAAGFPQFCQITLSHPKAKPELAVSQALALGVAYLHFCYTLLIMHIC